MRKIYDLASGWRFEQPGKAPAEVTLPHTWNNVDGQDGGDDYFRGVCTYTRRLEEAKPAGGSQVWLEITGAAMIADVLLNGAKLFHHEGGFSTFRVDLTGALRADGENILEIAVDNSANDHCYPQMADFTFYGGLYRAVRLIEVPAAHFALGYYGTPGIRITPVVSDDLRSAVVTATAWVEGGGERVTFDVAGQTKIAPVVDGAASAEFLIEDVHLWDGVKDPYLYTAKAVLDGGADEVSARFGCRVCSIDPEKGFILNHRPYPLRGVARHQDRWGIGNALLPEHHQEDMALIREMGANTVRLAHYQHDQYFYDLCDENGLVVWAEIPYISDPLKNGRENTLSQMRELIVQNYNHPSIAVWGLSNEVWGMQKGAKASGEVRDAVIENHMALNDLAHELDPTRPTVIAVLSACDINEPYIQIPDVVSYNLYFGWYGGDTSMYGPWLDEFHKKFPNVPIGVSEYGAEALNWHSSAPRCGDYTEEYQAMYHEEVIKQLYSRQYVWATHVWNMFDFGADGRNEGGENGQNHKGLVTFDRTYKKDAFYAYKAWLSAEPFVHICGKRYVDRVEDVTRVKVYSNQPEVELFVNGVSLGTQRSPEHFFCFDVPNVGESALRAVAGACSDESVIRKVEKFNEAYRYREEGVVLNWFDVTEREGFYSLNNTVDDILKSPEATKAIKDIMSSAAKIREQFPWLFGMTVVKAVGALEKMTGTAFTKEQLLAINDELNMIEKP